MTIVREYKRKALPRRVVSWMPGSSPGMTNVESVHMVTALEFAAVANLGVEPEVHHIAVGDDILLAFQPELAGVARTGLA